MFEPSQDPFRTTQYHPVFGQSKDKDALRPNQDSDGLDADPSERKSAKDTKPRVESNAEKRRHRFKLFLLGLVLFIFFFLAKIPQARITNLILAHLKIATQAAGFVLTVKSSEMSFLLRPHLILSEVEIRSLENEKAVLKINELYLRPHLLSLLPFVENKAATVNFKMLGGEIGGTVAGSAAGFAMDLDLDSLNLTSTSLLKQYVPVEFSHFELDGDLDFAMNFADPKKNRGTIDLELKSLALAEQNIFGFQLPKISTQANELHLKFKGEKIQFTEVKLGKDLKKDDVVAEITGEITVLPVAPGSYAPFGPMHLNLALATHFLLSPALHKSIPFLDSILGSAKSKDGRYSYSIRGNLPMPAVEPTP